MLLYPNINAERSRKGWSIERLANEMGVTRKTVYNWMSKGKIPQSSLAKMSCLFGCSIDYLLAPSRKSEPAEKSSR